MNRAQLEKMTVDELVERYAEICLAQDEALLYDEHTKFKTLFRRMNTVEHELRSRGQEARRALTRLYDHPNMQVRLQAAKETLAVSPSLARQVLETIKDSKLLPQALDAGMSLWNLDRGVFKPD